MNSSIKHWLVTIFVVFVYLSLFQLSLKISKIDNFINTYEAKIANINERINEIKAKQSQLELLIASLIESQVVYEIEVVATAYTNSEGEIRKEYLDGLTATGLPVGLGIVAVDPDIIPLGSVIYIPKFKQFFIALDTGSKIKGNRIDIYFLDKRNALKFGKQKVTVVVCGKIQLPNGGVKWN